MSDVQSKTSRTLLQNLLPRPSLNCTGPGSIVHASLEHTTWSQMYWLGGRGFSELSFYIHGLEGIKPNGSTVYGSFFAVIFVDTADNIAGEREELEIPKVFCEFELELNSKLARSGICCDAIVQIRKIRSGELCG